MRRRPLFVRALTSVRFVLVKKGNNFEFGGSASVVCAEKGRNKVRTGSLEASQKDMHAGRGGPTRRFRDGA